MRMFCTINEQIRNFTKTNLNALKLKTSYPFLCILFLPGKQ